MDFDTTVKLHIYETIAATTRAPKLAEVAAALDSPVADVQQAFQRLADKRLLFLDPDSSEIIMAPPFSAVETIFRVETDGKSYYANCIWDSLGIAAALHRDVDVSTSCGDCGEPMALRVRGGAPVAQPCIIHFAVPAAHWWDDIVYT